MNRKEYTSVTWKDKKRMKEFFKAVVSFIFVVSVSFALAVGVNPTTVFSKDSQLEDTTLADAKKIVSFEEPEIVFSEVEKTTLADIEKQFPETLKVKLEDGTTAEVDAKWSCADDYDNSNAYVYYFDLTLPDDYEVAENCEPAKIIVIRKGFYETNLTAQYPEHPNSTITLAEWLGAQNVVGWLKSKETTNYYLGTRYRGNPLTPAVCAHPYGEYPGDSGMNCTGFIASVMRKCGGDLSKITTRLNGSYVNAVNWQDTVGKNNIKSYKFSSIKAALNSGKLKKGDIIYFEPNNWSASGGGGLSFGVFLGRDAE